jgi:adenosine/AMP kinase
VLEITAVPLKWQEGCNIIVGQSHFIKTVEDIAEIVVSSVPGMKYGLAFNEASGPCLVRTEGNDPDLVNDAAGCAQAVGAGHTFYLVIKNGYPINILNQIKACQEVACIYAATANPLELLVARTEQGRGVVGVVDGSSPRGVETDRDRQERKALLRRFGYKL